jgi:hypothetical protein
MELATSFGGWKPLAVLWLVPALLLMLSGSFLVAGNTRIAQVQTRAGIDDLFRQIDGASSPETQASLFLTDQIERSAQTGGAWNEAGARALWESLRPVFPDGTAYFFSTREAWMTFPLTASAAGRLIVPEDFPVLFRHRAGDFGLSEEDIRQLYTLFQVQDFASGLTPLFPALDLVSPPLWNFLQTAALDPRFGAQGLHNFTPRLLTSRGKLTIVQLAGKQ